MKTTTKTTNSINKHGSNSRLYNYIISRIGMYLQTKVQEREKNTDEADMCKMVSGGKKNGVGYIQEREGKKII